LSFTPAKVGNPFVVAQKKVVGFLFFGDLGMGGFGDLLGQRLGYLSAAK
jgi:hypothetical protein